MLSYSLLLANECMYICANNTSQATRKISSLRLVFDFYEIHKTASSDFRPNRASKK